MTGPGAAAFGPVHGGPATVTFGALGLALVVPDGGPLFAVDGDVDGNVEDFADDGLAGGWAVDDRAAAELLVADRPAVDGFGAEVDGVELGAAGRAVE